MIDRRRCIMTGLAALAVAGVVPALPASAALPVVVPAESAATQWLRRWVEVHNTPCGTDAGLFASSEDRRELLAVAAATAAAAVVPGLSAGPAPLIRSGVMMTGRRFEDGGEPEWVAFHARWHFQKWPEGRTICHCDTGLMFATTLDRPLPVYELIRPADLPPLPVDARTLKIIGYATRLAGLLASQAGGNRREAFFYQFAGGGYYDRRRITDAPPLPFFG